MFEFATFISVMSEDRNIYINIKTHEEHENIYTALNPHEVVNGEFSATNAVCAHIIK